MGNSNNKETGRIAWIDLTVPNAEQLKDFYKKVVGWKPEPVNMGEYDDFNMNPPGGGDAAAGVCHARGANAALPPQWLIYIVVENLNESVSKCIELGGEIISDRRNKDGSGFCVIRDPAGAVAALYQVKSK